MAIAAMMQGAITGMFDYNNAIRAPYLSNEELAQLAAGLTVRDCVSLPAFEPFIFKKRLKNNEEAILQAFKSTVAAYEDDKMIAPAAGMASGQSLPCRKEYTASTAGVARTFLPRIAGNEKYRGYCSTSNFCTGLALYCPHA